MPNRVERIAEEKARAFQRAEQIADHWKPAALDAGIKDRWSAGLIDAPLDLRRLQLRIDLLRDADELSRSLQVGHAGAEAAVHVLSGRRLQSGRRWRLMSGH